MAKKTNLDNYEKDILESYENNEWNSSKNLNKRAEELKKYVEFTQKAKIAISLRVSEDDLYDIKKKSLELGIPYQNLIQGLIHKFNAGEIRLV